MSTFSVGSFVCFDVNRFQTSRKTSNGERNFLEKFGEINNNFILCKVTKGRYPDLTNAYISVLAYNPRNGELIAGGYIMEDHIVPIEMGMSEYNSEQISVIKKKLNKDDQNSSQKKTDKPQTEEGETMSKMASLISDGKAAAKIGVKVKAGEVITSRTIKMITALEQCPTPIKILSVYKAANPLVALALAGAIKYLPVEDERLDFIHDCLLNYGMIDFINKIPVDDVIDKILGFVPEEAKQYMPEKKKIQTATSSADE